MKSIRTKAFKKLFARLPAPIQKQATADYEVFKRNLSYPGRCFKRIDPEKPIYSVRIGMDYRAVRVMEKDMIRWYWIGSHEDYNKL
jgi:hypothetical protein